MINTTQTNLNLWNGILEQQRCIKSQQMHMGTISVARTKQCTHIITHSQHPLLANLTISCLGQLHTPLTKLQLYTPHQYLGVHITMNGDWKKKLAALQTCNQKYMQALTKCLLSRQVKVIYQQCYIPSVMYPHSTSISHPTRKTQQRTETNNNCFSGKNGISMYFPMCSCLCT